MQTVREIATKEELEKSVPVIRQAFRTVADEFGVTRENNPSHGAFIELPELLGLQEKGARFFGLFEENRQTGFVSIRPSSWTEVSLYLEKLAVIPGERRKGSGRELLEHACRYARGQGKKSILVGIINDHTILKKWYTDRGFREVGLKQYPHLPFTVCHMEREV